MTCLGPFSAKPYVRILHTLTQAAPPVPGHQVPGNYRSKRPQVSISLTHFLCLPLSTAASHCKKSNLYKLKHIFWTFLCRVKRWLWRFRVNVNLYFWVQFANALQLPMCAELWPSLTHFNRFNFPNMWTFSKCYFFAVCKCSVRNVKKKKKIQSKKFDSSDQKWRTKHIFNTEYKY